MKRKGYLAEEEVGVDNRKSQRAYFYYRPGGIAKSAIGLVILGILGPFWTTRTLPPPFFPMFTCADYWSGIIIVLRSAYLECVSEGEN